MIEALRLCLIAIDRTTYDMPRCNVSLIITYSSFLKVFRFYDHFCTDNVDVQTKVVKNVIVTTANRVRLDL